MLHIPHGEGEIGGWKTKKSKAVVGSNRVLLHGTLAEQLHHPFSFCSRSINNPVSFFRQLAACECEREESIFGTVECVLRWNLSEKENTNSYFYCYCFSVGAGKIKIYN